MCKLRMCLPSFPKPPLTFQSLLATGITRGQVFCARKPQTFTGVMQNIAGDVAVRITVPHLGNFNLSFSDFVLPYPTCCNRFP